MKYFVICLILYYLIIVFWLCLRCNDCGLMWYYYVIYFMYILKCYVRMIFMLYKNKLIVNLKLLCYIWVNCGDVY